MDRSPDSSTPNSSMPNSSTEPLSLLIPLDATAFSRQVLAQVQRLFPPERAAITLLHVFEEEPAGTLPAAEQPHYRYGSAGGEKIHHTFDKEGLDAAGRAIAERLEREAEELRAHGYQARTLLRRGRPAEEIAACVDREGFDLVAMATHGRTGIGQLLLGSVAQGVVARVRVPVVLLRGEPA